MILSNLTHSEKGAIEFVRALQDGPESATRDVTLHQLVDIFDRRISTKEQIFTIWRLFF